MKWVWGDFIYNDEDGPNHLAVRDYSLRFPGFTLSLLEEAAIQEVLDAWNLNCFTWVTR
jgi:hypothetical protein